jgi:hydroxymethylpyrimidine/phosphomethylpyrimidine kinase
LDIAATKIGMLSQPGVIDAVAAGLDRNKAQNIVLDPVMVSASGHRLLAQDAEATLKRALFPRALVVTPNLHEAAALLDAPLARDEPEMRDQAERIRAFGAKTVLIKGGHAKGAEAVDLLVDERGARRLVSPRYETLNTHGTGCTLSSAIAAYLARGEPLLEAVTLAKNYVTAAIAAADQLNVGHGHGPVHHFHAQWERPAQGGEHG